MELAWCYAAKGLYEDAFVELDKAKGINPEFDAQFTFSYAHVLALVGEREKAVEQMNELKKQGVNGYVDPVLMAMICSGLGEKDKAFDWFDRGFQSRASHMMELQTVAEREFWFKNISSDPRYATLLKKMKFPNNN